MTVMRNVIKTSKLFAAILCIVGAFILAPTCAAYDDSSIPQPVKDCLDTSLTATGWNKADCSFFSVHYFWNGSGYYCTYLIHSIDVKYVDFHVNSNGNNGNFGLDAAYSDEYNHNSTTMLDFYMYSEEYSLGGLNDSSSVGYGDFPFEVVTSFPAEYFSCNVPSAVDVNAMTPPIETSSDTYSNVLLWEYLIEKGYDIDTPYAWIILDYGEPLQLPISSSEPVNYEGDYYLKRTHYTPYLERFELVELNDDIDYSRYIDSRICIRYIHDITTLDLYALYTDKTLEPTIDMYDDLPDGSVITATNLNAVPNLYVFDGISYVGKCLHYEGEENDSYPVYITYDIGNLMSAIPRYNTLLLGIDLTVTDANDTEIVGRNTSNYNTFVTNYNQKAVTGLSGFITGRTAFTGDWRGNSIDTTINYQNDFTFSDSNVSSLFAAVFSMGDGFVLTAAIGVMSIALAAYVLFGKH